MQYLLDTGILLRVVNRDDPVHAEVRAAVRSLKDRGHTTIAAAQNIIEFWNVCTRPSTARGGLGLTHDQAARRLHVVERIVTILHEPSGIYDQWKSIVVQHKVQGVQVHDVRPAAFMVLHQVSSILTLNKQDFMRFASLTAYSPRDVNASP